MRTLFAVTFLFILCQASLPAQNLYDEVVWYQQFFEPFDPSGTAAELGKVEKKLADAHEQLDFPATILGHQELGLLHLTRTHDYQQALDHFLKALSLGDSLNLRERQTFTYLGTAAVFEAIGDLNKSAQELEKALQINDTFRNEAVLVMILNRLGNMHVRRGNIEAAEDNFELALAHRDEISQAQLAETLYNQALLLNRVGKNGEALEKHKEALALWRTVHDRKHEAQSLAEIGDLYRQMNNDDREYANHLAALEIRKSLKDPAGMAESYNSMGILYYRKKNYQRSVANLQLALTHAKEAQHHQAMRTSNEYLAYCYKALGDYRLALRYQEDYNALADLIQQEMNEQKLIESQNQYILQKHEEEIAGLEQIRKQKEAELAEQQRIQRYLFMIVGLLMIIGLLVWWMYTQKRKSNRELQAAHAVVTSQNEQLQELNATKDKFFSIISHDVKGPLNSLTSFSGMLVNHFDALSKEEIQMLAQDSDKSLKNLFAMLENLLEWARSQTGNISLKPEPLNLHDLLIENKSLLEPQAANKRITILHEVSEPVMVNADRNSITTVIRNLLSNAIKFTPAGGLVTLEAHASKGEARVSIRDTGVGMRKEIVDKLFRIDTKHSTKGTANEKGTGLGLILCKEFVEKNSGKISVTSEEGKGSVFYFTLPSHRN